MTRMLVVVRSAEDAAIALAGGADGLVVRPSAEEAGDRPILEAIGRTVARRCPVTLSCADRVPEDMAAAVESCGADEVLFRFDEGRSLPPAGGVRMGAVLPFADRVEEREFEAVATRGFGSVVFGDGGQPRRLLEAVTVGHLQQQVRWARARHLAIGFAGTMEMPDIPRLLAIVPDVLLFDDVVRPQASASSRIDPERIRVVRALMPRAGLAGSAAPLVGGGETTVRDRIFVRDWTVSIHVGAYAYEHKAQRVRFTVEVEVVRTAARTADIRDVVTYDLITDAIGRATVAHVDLVETIAEDVATAILAHPRVVSVDVTVEKLDLGPGSLGCRIVRSRNAKA